MQVSWRFCVSRGDLECCGSWLHPQARLDITGACWRVDAAEAVLTLRSPISHGDFDSYGYHHLAQEHHRVHTTRYLGKLVRAA